MCVCVCVVCVHVCVCVCEVTKLIEVIVFGTFPVCDHMHCVNCVDSEICVVVSAMLSWLLFVLCVRRLLLLLLYQQSLMGWSLM